MALQPEEFAAKLRELREQHMVPSKEAAAQKIGISVRHYDRWEQGVVAPRIESVQKVADAYGLDAHELWETIASGDGGISARLERLEADLSELLAIARETLPPLAAALEEGRIGQAGRSSARRRGAKGS